MLWFLAVPVGLVALYVLIGRPWLRRHAPGFFATIEPVEIALWKKSETILWARLKMLSGVLLTILTQAGTIDLTPLVPFVPETYRPLVTTAVNMLPMSVTFVGFVDEWLRRRTTKPLELVAVPDNAPLEVSQAVAKADAAKIVAVATVQEAKAEGAV